MLFFGLLFFDDNKKTREEKSYTLDKAQRREREIKVIKKRTIYVFVYVSTKKTATIVDEVKKDELHSEFSITALQSLMELRQMI